MRWINRLATQFGLTRNEVIVITGLIGFFVTGTLLSSGKGYIEKQSLIEKIELEQFTGDEADSTIAAQLAEFDATVAKQKIEKDSLDSHDRSFKLNFNSASETDLADLPEIGPAMANRLVRFRNYKGGKLKSMLELLEVKGISENKLERLKPFLEVK